MEELVYIYNFVFKMCLPTIVKCSLQKISPGQVKCLMDFFGWNYFYIIFVFIFYIHFCISFYNWGRRGRDRMVVGFTTTYAISAYHHWCCEFESRSGRGVKHYVIKFVRDLRQVSGFLRVSSTNNTNHHDITEILLKMVLNTIKQNQTKPFCNWILQHSSLNL